jgi:hypothetical protein
MIEVIRFVHQLNIGECQKKVIIGAMVFKLMKNAAIAAV